MKTIRLESTKYGYHSSPKEGVDKLFEFDSESGILNTYVLDRTRLIMWQLLLLVISL